MNLCLLKIIAVSEGFFGFINKLPSTALPKMTSAGRRALLIRVQVFVFLSIFCLAVNVAAAVRSVQDIQVSGYVTDVAGDALPGVSILVKGTDQGTITDLEGRYVL